MATRQDLLALNSSVGTARSPSEARFLFNPTIDFLCLGGGSLLVFALVALFLTGEAHPEVAAVMLLVAHAVNHPHFAHSYQIFYKNFAAKITGRGYSSGLRIRYILAGIVVPIALASFFVGAVLAGAPRTIGLAGNIMTFFVGWHYVKQGYGMLILDSVLKKRFFGDREKRVFLVNSYATWLSFWLFLNSHLSGQKMWGLEYYAIPVPMPLAYAALSVAGLTALFTIYTILARLVVRREPVAWNGVVAYSTSVYAWLFLAFAPLFGLLIPAFHSLQYLVVVWRYRLNLEKASSAGDEPSTTAPHKRNLWPARAIARFGGFVALGAILGYIAFWGLPKVLNAVVPYDKAAFGPTLFLFIFWIFINVHHYFLDNVMWRRGNPDTMKHLFS